MREAAMEEQIQQVLSYVQGELVDIWKENVLEDLEGELLEYETVEEFLVDIKKEFGEEDKESAKVAELKKVEQDIYYQEHREKTEIDVIGGQKQSVILGMLWLAHHNSEIDWKTGEVKMTRCLEK